MRLQPQNCARRGSPVIVRQQARNWHSDVGWAKASSASPREYASARRVGLFPPRVGNGEAAVAHPTVDSSFELRGEGHRAGAATRAAHGEENVLLLLLVEVGAVDELARLLLEQGVQRKAAIGNLIFGGWRRGGLGRGSPRCPLVAPHAAGRLALGHFCLRSPVTYAVRITSADSLCPYTLMIRYETGS